MKEQKAELMRQEYYKKHQEVILCPKQPRGESPIPRLLIYYSISSLRAQECGLLSFITGRILGGYWADIGRISSVSQSPRCRDPVRVAIPSAHYPPVQPRALFFNVTIAPHSRCSSGSVTSSTSSRLSSSRRSARRRNSRKRSRKQCK